MKDATILKAGLKAGRHRSVIAAICCFTPALVILLGAVALTVCGLILWRRHR